MSYIMRKSSDVECCQALNAHGGLGTILVRQLVGCQDGADFPGDPKEIEGKVNFVHLLDLPSGTSIGNHLHDNTEEIYFVVEGIVTMIADGKSIQMPPNSIFFIKKGSSHAVENNSDKTAKVLVVEWKLD